MVNIKTLLISINILMINVPPIFANDDYICKIERLSITDTDDKTQKFYENNYIGKTFTVDRVHGIMAGILKNSYLTKPQIIDYGSKDNSYKVITPMTQNQGIGAGSSINALNILEYKEGEKKPFVFLQNDIVFFGTCTHF